MNDLFEKLPEPNSENIKVNKIELVVHQNSSYLKKMYKLYFFDSILLLS